VAQLVERRASIPKVAKP